MKRFFGLLLGMALLALAASAEVLVPTIQWSDAVSAIPTSVGGAITAILPYVGAVFAVLVIVKIVKKVSSKFTG